MTPLQLANLVDGTWRASAAERWVEVRNPADQREVVAEVPAMGPPDVDAVFDAAVRALPGWAQTSPIARGRILISAAHLLRERRDEVARDLSREMGKTLAEALVEVAKSADLLEYCGGLGRAPQGDVLADERLGARAWTVHEPIGVVLAICPWNDPLLTPARKLGPALIAGNVVVLKPASDTPVVALHLARALADAGLPAGVLGTVTGPARELGDSLVEQRALAGVSFTGSNEVGEQLRRQLAGRNVKLLAELGGKNATVVLEDADVELAAGTIAAAAFAQAGQRCTATSRLILERGVFDELLDKLAAHARELTVGDPLDPDTTMGPLVSPAQQRTVTGFVERAVAAGAAVITGAEPLPADLAHGCFSAPKVLRDVDPSMEIWTEEVFGPVLVVTAVEDFEQALARVNDSPFGLAASVFTGNVRRALAFSEGVTAGQVSINLPTTGWDVHMPFGGFKASGSGLKEQGLEGLSFYRRTKTVAMAA
jgi:acyl-CoA reductase-like NAD-dependent aldehyde dehydrogenase